MQRGKKDIAQKKIEHKIKCISLFGGLKLIEKSVVNQQMPYTQNAKKCNIK